MDFSSIGRNIQTIRNQKGLTQRQLAEKTGLDEGYISVIECGKRMPSLKSLISILNALETSADSILSGVLITGAEQKRQELGKKLSKLSKEEADIVSKIADIITRSK